MATRARFKKLTDLYVKQKEIELPDGGKIIVRALNAFERDECLDAAQVARSRVVMALKEAGEERLKVEARVLEVGLPRLAEELAEVAADDEFPKIVNSIRDDPDWSERLTILERTDLLDGAHEPSDEEIALISKINSEYMAELDRRKAEELELKLELNRQLGDDEIIDAYHEAWLDKKGRKVANDEYLITEIFLATRWPDGEQVFDSKREVRECPAELFESIAQAINDLQMEARDPKDSGSALSFSELSLPPSEVEESDSSGSAETPTRPRGTSPQLSTTP